jgi:hypothetical protein
MLCNHLFIYAFESFLEIFQLILLLFFPLAFLLDPIPLIIFIIFLFKPLYLCVYLFFPLFFIFRFIFFFFEAYNPLSYDFFFV